MSSRYASDFVHFYRGPRPIDVPGHKPCDHAWDGWENFADGHGGTTVCTKCGLTAINHTLAYDDFPARERK